MGRVRAPLVSVVIPTYQRRQLVLRAVKSALAQRYSPFEVIVADDGSTDGTVEALRALADPRLTVLAREHEGVSSARNGAIDAARGDVVAFLDSDDRWLPHHLATVTEMLDRWPEAVLATTAPDYAAFGRRRPRAAKLIDPMPRILVSSFVGPISSVAVRRTALVEAGSFAADLAYAEETDLYRRLALAGPFTTLRSRTAVMQRTRGSVTDQTRAVGGQFAASDLALARLEERVRGTPRAAELTPRVEGMRAFLAGLAAAREGDEEQSSAKLLVACALCPELRSEPVAVLGRVLATLGAGTQSASPLETVARLWPHRDDETAVALRAYAGLRALAAGSPRRAARAARGLSVRATAKLARDHAPAVGLYVWKALDRRLHTAPESPLLAVAASPEPPLAAP